MTTHAPNEDFAWGFGGTFKLSSLSTFVNAGPMHLDNLVERPRDLFRNAAHGFQGLVSSLGSTHATPECSAPQDEAVPRSSSGAVQQVTDTAQAPTPIASNNPATRDAEASEAASQMTTDGDNGLSKAICTCRKRWILLFVVGFLSLALIVVPGLVLGVVMGQLPLGIALSGTIGTVCGFYAGPVYNLISAGEADGCRCGETGEEMV